MKEILTKKQLREFGLVVGIGIPIIIGFLVPLLLGHSFRIWTLWLACPLLLSAIFNPQFLFYPYKGWIGLGYLLGRINSTLILGLIYIFLVIPIAFFMKIFKYDPLRQKRFNKKSYYENNKEHKIDLTKIF